MLGFPIERESGDGTCVYPHARRRTNPAGARVKELLDQISGAMQAGQYYVALFCALMVPDICGALQSADGEARADRYRDWYDLHLAPRYTFGTRVVLSAEDCYYFRCSMLHQGSTQHSKGQYERVLFIEPDATTTVVHASTADGALIIDVRIFCSDIVEAATQWLDGARHSENVKTNLTKLIRRYPEGLPPYITGVTVIS